MNTKQQARYNKLEKYRTKYEAMLDHSPDYWRFVALQTRDLSGLMTDVETDRQPLADALSRIVVA